MNKDIFASAPCVKSSENEPVEQRAVSSNARGNRGALNRGHHRKTIATPSKAKKVGKGLFGVPGPHRDNTVCVCVCCANINRACITTSK